MSSRVGYAHQKLRHNQNGGRSPPYRTIQFIRDLHFILVFYCVGMCYLLALFKKGGGKMIFQDLTLPPFLAFL